MVLTGNVLGGTKGPYKEGARVYSSVDIATVNVTVKYCDFDLERFDTDIIHDTSSNPSRLTCKTAGKYYIAGVAAFDADDTGMRAFMIRLNGTTFITRQDFQTVTVAGHYTIGNPSCEYDLEVGDYVEFGVYQTSGGNLDLKVYQQTSIEFMMQRTG